MRRSSSCTGCGCWAACPSPSTRATSRYARVPGIETVDFSVSSLYQTLEERYGIVATRADYALEALGATPAEAALLDVAVGAPLLGAGETMYDQFDQPTDIGRITYRGDRYRFRATLMRRNA